MATLQESLQNTTPLLLSTFFGSDAFVEGGVVTMTPVSFNKKPPSEKLLLCHALISPYYIKISGQRR